MTYIPNFVLLPNPAVRHRRVSDIDFDPSTIRAIDPKLEQAFRDIFKNPVNANEKYEKATS